MSEIYVPRIAILASGNGSTAEACAEAVFKGELEAEIALVVTNKPEANVLNRAQRWNDEWGFHTETAIINQHTHPGRKQKRGQTLDESEAIANLLDDREIDLVAYLGYMRIAGGLLIRKYGFVPGLHSSKYQSRSLNSHPGPLPFTADTYGDGASKKVLAAYHAGLLKKSIHTVHVVAEEIDMGPKVAEHEVDIYPDDTVESLFDRVQDVEKEHIAEDIGNFWREQQEYH